VVLENSSRDWDSFFYEFIDFKIVNNKFFIDRFIFLQEDKQNFMENTKHLSKLFHLLIAFLDVTSEEERNSMHTLCTYFKSISFPP